MSKLIIEDQRGRRTAVPMTRDSVTIGRGEGNTIRLNERNVSRRHVDLIRRGERLEVVDTSRFGSTLNGQRFTGKAELFDGDVIEVGDYKIIVEFDRKAPETRAPLAPAWVDYGRARLVERHRDVPVRTWCLLGPTVLGASVDADLRIEAPSVLAKHVRIVPREAHWFLEVCHPATTVRMNAETRQRVVLKSGDVLELGGRTFTFVDDTEFAISLDPIEIGEPAPLPRRRQWTVVAMLHDDPSVVA